MPYPKQSDVEVPLLRALEQLGGQAAPQALYPLVAQQFPDLTLEEQQERMESAPAARKWWNLVRWVRQSLVQRGEIDGSIRDVWKITESGRSRLTGEGPIAAPSAPQRVGKVVGGGTETTLRDLANSAVDDVKARLVSELANLTPRAFEHFCIEFLQRLGYRDVSVTKRAHDGGIDGFGDFRQGAVRIKSAFQAKRWVDSPVGRPEIDKFRGAIQGQYDHGVFLTTSRFTADAEAASVRRGAITIMLLDGAAIAELMVEWGIGVVRQPLYVYEVDPTFFEFNDE